MLETLICALFTLLPDYLFRRYVQGKRIGHELTFFSVWYELRWGIVSCFMLTSALITALFYYHPATSTATSFFRTVTLLPQSGGRVDEVYVANNQQVKAGDPLFRLDASSQKAAVAAAQSRIAEVDAALGNAEAQLATAEAGVPQAEAALNHAQQEYARSKELQDRGSNAARQSELDRQENLVKQREGQLTAAKANVAAVQQQIDELIPAQRVSAAAALTQAQVELDKTLVTAGVAGTIEQLSLQVGDYVSPVLRPAGILVPSEAGRWRVQAGFNQMHADVIRPGMVGEIGCMTKTFTVIPMVVVEVQDVIPSGQLRPGDQLLDAQNLPPPGGLVVYLEPIYPDQFVGIPPGSRCLANVYTDNHARLEHEDLGTLQFIWLHVVDTIGVVHAAGLRLRMLMMPVQTLLFSGGH